MFLGFLGVTCVGAIDGVRDSWSSTGYGIIWDHGSKTSQTITGISSLPKSTLSSQWPEAVLGGLRPPS